MKTIKIKSSFWVGDKVYGIAASPADEKNKINYLVKPMKVCKVHYLPDADCRIAFTVRKDESGAEHSNTSEAFTDSKDYADKVRKEWEEKLPEWRDDWMQSFKKYDILMGELEHFLRDSVGHIVEVDDDMRPLSFHWTKTAMKLCRMLSPNIWTKQSAFRGEINSESRSRDRLFLFLPTGWANCTQSGVRRR